MASSTSLFERGDRLDLTDAAGGLARLVEVLGRVGAEEQLLANLVDRLALLAHDVVVLEDVLAHVEVALLDLPLRVADRSW